MINFIRLHLKLFLKKYFLLNQFCKKCGKSNEYDFSVSDEEWVKLPEKYHNHVLCFNCFIEEYPSDEFNCNITFYKL